MYEEPKIYLHFFFFTTYCLSDAQSTKVCDLSPCQWFSHILWVALKITIVKLQAKYIFPYRAQCEICIACTFSVWVCVHCLLAICFTWHLHIDMLNQIATPWHVTAYLTIGFISPVAVSDQLVWWSLNEGLFWLPQHSLRLKSGRSSQARHVQPLGKREISTNDMTHSVICNYILFNMTVSLMALISI